MMLLQTTRTVGVGDGYVCLPPDGRKGMMERIVCKVEHQDPDDIYSSVIERFLLDMFPNTFKQGGEQTLDLVTNAIVTTGQVRYGPVPKPESLVDIRSVIAHWIAKGEPIPFLSSWGSEKPDGSGMDVAEMMAMKTLMCLNQRVESVYQPGVVINIRLEDASAPHLFHDRAEEARREAKVYVDGFKGLVKVLGYDKVIHPRPESEMITEAEYSRKSDIILPYMVEALRGGNPHWLIDKGWIMPPSEAVNYYLKSYEKLYPGIDPMLYVDRVARYFSEVLARQQLGILGDNTSWGGKYLEVYFGNQPPGIPLKARRLLYRPMPSSMTNMRIAPWRAKGYIRVGNETTTASLVSFAEKLEFNKHSVLLKANGVEQRVQSDYVIV